MPSPDPPSWGRTSRRRGEQRLTGREAVQAGQRRLPALCQPDGIEESRNVLAPSCAARVPALAGWAGPIQSPGCARLHSSAGIAVSQRPSTLSSPGPTRGTCNRSARVSPAICSPGSDPGWRGAPPARAAGPCWRPCSALSASWRDTPACHAASASSWRARESESSAARASRAGCRFSPPRQGARPVRLPA